MNTWRKVGCCLFAAAAAVGGFAETTLDYVRDGLVAQWDGIDNAGTGQHDSAATTWTDLVGGRNFTLHDVAIGDRYLAFDGTKSYGQLATGASDAFPSGVKTVEIVINLGTTDGIALHGPNGSGVTFGPWSGGYILINNIKKGIGYDRPELDVDNVYATVYGSDNMPKDLNLNGASCSPGNADDFWGAPDASAWLGRRSNGRYFKGKIFAVRVYNRALTPEEVTHNYKIDCERFFSALPGLEVAPVSDQIFDGMHPVRPNFVVWDTRDPLLTPLSEGADYTVTITGNDRLGLAQAHIQGVNSYEGMAVSTSFRMISESTLPPEGYVRLSSLTTDGRQYFATGFTPDETTIVTNCQFLYTAAPSNASGWGCLFSGNFGANGFILMYQNTGLNWWGAAATRIYDADPVGHEMEFSIGPAGDGTRTARLVVDGAQANVVTGLNTSQFGALTFFNDPAHNNPSSVRFYRTTFVKGGTVARDFVPVLRLADNRVGVYDLVNDKFYANQGTSTDFQAGPAITANLVISPVVDGNADFEHPYRPTVTVTREGSEEPLTEGVDYRLVWPETKCGVVYLNAIGLGQLKGAHGATSYRQFVEEPVDAWLSSSTSPTFTTNIGQRLVYVFDYTDMGKTMISTRQTMTLGEVLVVGGGGAGGWMIGGGGGGGGVREIACSHLLSAGQRLSLSVGAGGKLDDSEDGQWRIGYEGAPSSLEFGGISYVALGGGGGGAFHTAPTATGNLASAGGYGNDYRSTCEFTDGLHYTSAQGNPGGTSTVKSTGGGGGAGESGGNGVDGIAGSGGEGVLSSICGYPVFQGHRAVYGSGGGGGAGNLCETPGSGGTNAGAGAAKNGGVDGGSAVNGFGGGGGGGGSSLATRGGAGGHGRIVLSFFAGDTSGKMLAVEPLSNTLASSPKPRVYDPSHPTKVLREGVDFRYEYQTNNPKATKEDPGQGVVIAVGLGDYAGVSADTWYDSYRGAGLILIMQ